MPRWPEKARVRSIHQTPTGRWSALVICPDGVARRFQTAREPLVSEWVKHPRRRPVKVRFEVFARDEFTCQYCGAKAPDVELRVDHVVPIAKGGTDEPSNLITSCEPCNSGKGARHSGGVVDQSPLLYESGIEIARAALNRFAEMVESPHMAARVAASDDN